MCQILDRQLRHNNASANQIRYILVLHILVAIFNSTQKKNLQLLSSVVETAKLIQLLILLSDPLCFILVHYFLVTFLSVSSTSALRHCIFLRVCAFIA